MSPWVVVAIFAAFTVVASLVGGWVPRLIRMTHAKMQLMMSLVAGLMLGVGLFLMLPHAAAQLPSLDQAVLWMMAGLLVTFLLQRFFHFHQHEVPQALSAGDEAQGNHAEHSHALGRPPAHDHHALTLPHGSWLGVALGLVLHSLLDGMALAASVEGEARVHGDAGLAAFGTCLAICLHKPLDSMTIAALMLAGGWPPRSRQSVNALFALVCPAGAALFYLSLGGLAANQELVVGCALAFSAGTFLCISLSDLLPEIQFHSHDRIKLSLALVIGVTLAFGIVRLEEWAHGSGHSHEPGGRHGHDHGNGHGHPHGDEDDD